MKEPNHTGEATVLARVHVDVANEESRVASRRPYFSRGKNRKKEAASTARVAPKIQSVPKIVIAIA